MWRYADGALDSASAKVRRVRAGAPRGAGDLWFTEMCVCIGWIGGSEKAGLRELE